MKKVTLLVVFTLLFSLGFSFADVPCKINYQGRLIKDSVPVNGTANMEFKLYTQQTGGTAIKTISMNNVPVYNGLFRAVLDLEGINWAAGQTMYLELKVGTDILSPREEIYAYPYAINTRFLEGQAKEYFINTSGEAQTKNGNLNIMGNVGIGTTSPITKLDVRYPDLETARFYGTGANAGYISLGYHPTNGYGLIGAYSSGGAAKNLILNNGGGYVGIGTTGPGYELDVAGDINIPADKYLRIAGSAGSSGQVLTRTATGMTWGTITGTLPIGTSGQTLRYAGTNWVANSVLSNDGTRITINGTVDNLLTLSRSGATYSTVFKVGTNSALIVNSGGSDVLTLKGDYVGIGTTLPNTNLHVMGKVLIQGGITPTLPKANLHVYGNVNIGDSNGCAAVYFANTGLLASFRIRSDDDPATYELNSERLFIKNTGEVGIGTISPQGALDVVSTVGGFIVPRMTTVQRDALTAVNGMIIYNTTTNQFNFRENGAWVLK